LVVAGQAVVLEQGQQLLLVLDGRRGQRAGQQQGEQEARACLRVEAPTGERGKLHGGSLDAQAHGVGVGGEDRVLGRVFGGEILGGFVGGGPGLVGAGELLFSGFHCGFRRGSGGGIGRLGQGGPGGFERFFRGGLGGGC